MSESRIAMLEAKVASLYEMLNTKLKVKHLEVEGHSNLKGRVNIGTSPNSESNIVKINGSIHHLGNISSSGRAAFNEGKAVFNDGHHTLKGGLNVLGNAVLNKNTVVGGDHIVKGSSTVEGNHTVEGDHTTNGSGRTNGEHYFSGNSFMESTLYISESIFIKNFVTEPSSSSFNYSLLTPSLFSLFTETSGQVTNQVNIRPSDISLTGTSSEEVFINLYPQTLYSSTLIKPGSSFYQTSSFSDSTMNLGRLNLNAPLDINSFYGEPPNGEGIQQQYKLTSFYNKIVNGNLIAIDIPEGSVVTNINISSLDQDGQTLITLNNSFYNNTENVISLIANKTLLGGNKIQLTSTDTQWNTKRNWPPREQRPIDWPFYNSNQSIITGCGKPNITPNPKVYPGLNNSKYATVMDQYNNQFIQGNKTGTVDGIDKLLTIPFDGSSISLSGVNCSIEAGNNVPIEFTGLTMGDEAGPDENPNPYGFVAGPLNEYSNDLIDYFNSYTWYSGGNSTLRNILFPTYKYTLAKPCVTSNIRVSALISGDVSYNTLSELNMNNLPNFINGINQPVGDDSTVVTEYLDEWYNPNEDEDNVYSLYNDTLLYLSWNPISLFTPTISKKLQNPNWNINLNDEEMNSAFPKWLQSPIDTLSYPVEYDSNIAEINSFEKFKQYTFLNQTYLDSSHIYLNNKAFIIYQLSYLAHKSYPYLPSTGGPSIPQYVLDYYNLINFPSLPNSLVSANSYGYQPNQNGYELVKKNVFLAPLYGPAWQNFAWGSSSLSSIAQQNISQALQNVYNYFQSQNRNSLNWLNTVIGISENLAMIGLLVLTDGAVRVALPEIQAALGGGEAAEGAAEGAAAGAKAASAGAAEGAAAGAKAATGGAAAAAIGGAASAEAAAAASAAAAEAAAAAGAKGGEAALGGGEAAAGAKGGEAASATSTTEGEAAGAKGGAGEAALGDGAAVAAVGDGEEGAEGGESVGAVNNNSVISQQPATNALDNTISLEEITRQARVEASDYRLDAKTTEKYIQARREAATTDNSVRERPLTASDQKKVAYARAVEDKGTKIKFDNPQLAEEAITEGVIKDSGYGINLVDVEKAVEAERRAAGKVERQGKKPGQKVTFLPKKEWEFRE